MILTDHVFILQIKKQVQKGDDSGDNSSITNTFEASHFPRCFVCTLFDPYNDFMRQAILSSPCYKWGNWGKEKFVVCPSHMAGKW